MAQKTFRTTEQIIEDLEKKEQYHLDAAKKVREKITTIQNRKPRGHKSQEKLLIEAIKAKGLSIEEVMALVK